MNADGIIVLSDEYRFILLTYYSNGIKLFTRENLRKLKKDSDYHLFWIIIFPITLLQNFV